MNLNLSSFLRVILGALIAAPLGWAISFLFPRGTASSSEQGLTLHQMGLIYGSLGGAAVTILALVIRDSRRPETGGAANFTMINGIGSMLIGKSEPHEDGSYLTTEWFCVLWLPIFPICNYRMMDLSRRRFLSGPRIFDIRGKHPVRLKDVARGYLFTAVAGCVLGLVIFVAAH